MKGVKAYNKGLKCRYFQFEEGKTFETSEKLRACESGFHFCKEENALSVLNYYPPSSEFTLVESNGEIIEHGDKCVTNKLSIGAKISLGDLFKIQFSILKEKVVELCKSSKEANTAGNESHANTAGNFSHANTAGNNSHANTAGNESHANTAGNESHANTAGNKSHANTAGNKSHANTAGDYSHANTAGNESHANTAGNNSHANTAGDYSHANTAGNESIACALGIQSKAKAVKGWIVIVDWLFVNDKWIINNIYSSKVGGKILDTIIESDKYYWFKDGLLKSE